MLRPAALVSASGGPIQGRVASRRFRGDHVLLVVDVADAPPLHVETRDGEWPARGDTIELEVRPGGAYVIPEAGAVPSAHEPASHARDG